MHVITSFLYISTKFKPTEMMINKFMFRNFVPACMVACAVVMGVMAPCNSFAQKAKARKKATLSPTLTTRLPAINIGISWKNGSA